MPVDIVIEHQNSVDSAPPVRRPSRLALVVGLALATACGPSPRPDSWVALAGCRPPAGAMLSYPAGSGAAALPACEALQLRLIAATLEAAASASGAARDAHRAAIALTFVDRLRDAESWLRRALALDPTSAAAWSDLAAVHLRFAASGTSPESAVQALEAALRAEELVPDAPLPQARSNRQAAAALVPAVDRDAPMRRDRLAALRRDASVARTDDRDLLAELVERDALGAWAEAVASRDGGAALAAATRARETAAAITGWRGDVSVAAAVTELTAADARLDVVVRAQAWTAYVRAVTAFEAGDTSRAATALAGHDATLRAIGPAVRGRALLLRSALHRVNGATTQARATVDSTDASWSFPVLDARRRWQRGLLDAEAGHLGAASTDYLRAQALFRDAGEREGDAMVSSLLASSYADLHDWAAAWVHERRALTLVPLCHAARQESVRTTGALIASAMSLHRAASAIRRPAISAATDAGQLVNAAFLLADEAVDRFKSGAARDALTLLDDADQASASLSHAGTRDMLDALLASTRATVVSDDDPERAQQLLQQALALYRARGSEFSTADVQLGRGRLLRRLGRDGEAEHALRDGLEITLAQSASLTSTVARADLRTARWDLLRSLAGILLDRGEPWEAYRLVEQLRDETTRARGSAGRPGAGHGGLSISYVDVGDHVQAWAVHADGRTDFVTAPAADLERVVERLRDALARGAAIEADAMELFDRLLAPVRLRLVDGQPLVICADGPLARLPFAVLQDRATRRRVYEVAPVLMSPTCLASAEPARRAARDRVLVAGDPAPASSSGRTRLPRARAEASEVAALYRDAEIVLGPQATKAALLEALPAARLFHFAGHAVAHPTRPALSHLVVAPSEADANGVLFASDISGLRLHTDLVVLAACDTAAGAPRHGAGVLGLADAFLSAGADRVVATQWPVPDGDAATFFVELHRRLLLASTAEDALRQTQQWAAARGMSPAMWAAPIAVGRPQAPVRPR